MQRGRTTLSDEYKQTQRKGRDLVKDFNLIFSNEKYEYAEAFDEDHARQQLRDHKATAPPAAEKRQRSAKINTPASDDSNATPGPLRHKIADDDSPMPPPHAAAPPRSNRLTRSGKEEALRKIMESIVRDSIYTDEHISLVSDRYFGDALEPQELLMSKNELIAVVKQHTPDSLAVAPPTVPSTPIIPAPAVGFVQPPVEEPMDLDAELAEFTRPDFKSHHAPSPYDIYFGALRSIKNPHEIQSCRSQII